jgi:hypothetical protein
MYGSDRKTDRPNDYKRAVVIDTGPKETQRMKPLFRVDGEVRSKNDLTEPALLERSGIRVDQELREPTALRGGYRGQVAWRVTTSRRLTAAKSFPESLTEPLKFL